MILYYTEDYLKPRFDPEDAGFDLRSAEDIQIQPMQIVGISTGISWDVSNGNFAYITGRSSMNAKGIIVHQGVIDAGYRGEWIVLIQNLSGVPYTITKGDRIAQAIVMQSKTHFIIPKQGKADANTSKRGTKGFGSTGKR